MLEIKSWHLTWVGPYPAKDQKKWAQSTTRPGKYTKIPDYWTVLYIGTYFSNPIQRTFKLSVRENLEDNVPGFFSNLRRVVKFYSHTNCVVTFKGSHFVFFLSDQSI